MDIALFLELNKKIEQITERLGRIEQQIVGLNSNLENLTPIAAFTPEQIKSLIQVLDGSIRAIAQDIKEELEDGKRVAPHVN